MSTCERCWADSQRDPYDTVERYHRLIKERVGDLACTPEQQAGPDARPCPDCGGRRVLHQHTGECMADPRHNRPPPPSPGKE